MHNGFVASDEKWGQFRDICNEIISEDSRPDEVARAWIALIESYNWQKRYPESGELAEQFLAEHNSEQYRSHLGEAHMMAAVADQEAGRYQSSFAHLRWIIENSSTDPSTDVAKNALTWAYYRLWYGVKQSGAGNAAVTEVLDEYRLKLPELAAEKIPYWENSER